MKLVLLGPPGAGKGTQAELLKKNLELYPISTGDMLREEAKAKTELGTEAKKYMDQGKLVPDHVVIQMVSHRIKEMEEQMGFVLDGFPRTRIQAENLDRILAELRKPIDLVIYCEASLPVIIRRLGGRRVCQECGVNYHLTNRPPKKPGICDQCGGVLYQRSDDTEQAIQMRLKAYEKQTVELINYYQTRGTLRRVSGDIEAVTLFEQLKTLFQKEGLL